MVDAGFTIHLFGTCPKMATGTTTLTGVFGLSWVALNLYEFSHIGILQPGSAVSAFYFTKNLLAGVFGALLISLLWSRVAKILLMISGMLFVGFNIYAVAHYDLMCVTPVVRSFFSTNGLLVGILIVLSIDLWFQGKTQWKTEQKRDRLRKNLHLSVPLWRRQPGIGDHQRNDAPHDRILGLPAEKNLNKTETQ